MKKIYVYLLLVTNILSISCMEKERRVLFPNNLYFCTQEIPLPIYLNSNVQPQQKSYLCTANEPGWEKLNDIANIQYNNKPVIKTPADLKPVYRPTISTNNTAQLKNTIIAQEKKPSLKTLTPVQPDHNLMQQLYNDAFYVLYDKNYNTKNQLVFNNKLSDLITNLKKAKHKGINEDLMATYAYEKWTLVSDVQYYVAVLFYCFKKYNLTTIKTPEDFPLNHNICTITLPTTDDFLEILGIECIQETSQRKVSSCDTTSQGEYPAYSTLVTSLYKLSQDNSLNIKFLISYLHLKQEVIIKNSPQSSYNDLKKIFYEKAYNLLCIKKICNQYINSNDLYDLLEIVDQIKKDHKKQELDLGYDILTIGDTETTTSKFFNYVKNDANYYATYTKNLINIFCKLIKRYNTEKLDKITPTDAQSLCYLLYQKLNFTLPDSFDTTLCDENKYAFTKFFGLFDNIVKLKQYDSASVQRFVNKTYPKRIDL